MYQGLPVQRGTAGFAFGWIRGLRALGIAFPSAVVVSCAVLDVQNIALSNITLFCDQLDLLETSHVYALAIVLHITDLVFQILGGDLVVFDHALNLKLLDTIADGNELGGTPEQTFHVDGANTFLQQLHVGGVIPRLHVQHDTRLGDDLGLCLRVMTGMTMLTDDDVGDDIVGDDEDDDDQDDDNNNDKGNNENS